MKKATVTRLVGLLPIVDEDWVVQLRYQGGGSDKEYRIGVFDTTTVYQYGRRDARGELIQRSHASVEDARKAALSQWAAKEAKGYWPMTGLVGGVDIAEFRVKPVLSVHHAHRAAKREFHNAATPGDRVWLVQREAHGTRIMPTDPENACLLAGTRDDTTMVLGVDPECERALMAVFPMAVRLDGTATTNAALVAQIAHSLADDAPGTSDRERFNHAVELAVACMQ